MYFLCQYLRHYYVNILDILVSVYLTNLCNKITGILCVILVVVLSHLYTFFCDFCVIVLTYLGIGVEKSMLHLLVSYNIDLLVSYNIDLVS